MTKLSRIILWSSAVILACVLLALLGDSSRKGGSLESYQAELRAQGEKLTFEELTCGRKTNRVDSQVAITNAAAKLGGVGLTPGYLKVREYVGPGRASVTWKQTSPTWSPSAGANRDSTWEAFDTQMQEVQGTLQEIRQALKEPAADAGPCTNMVLGRRVNFVAIRTMAQWLMGAAENDLHQGRLEAALQNLEALAGLARMERDEYTLVAQMIRVAVTGLGLSATWEALQAQGWTDPQLERLQKAWEPVDLLEAVEKGLLGARAAGHEVFINVRHSSGPQTGRLFRGVSSMGPVSSKATVENVLMDYLYLPVYKLAFINEDERFYLTTMQQSIAALRLVKAHRPWSEARQATLNVGARMNTMTSSAGKVRYFVSLISVPNFPRASERAVQAETERQMTLTAIALKRYQLRQGKLPPALQALVPEFLAAVPYDYLGSKPLAYRLNPGGGYVLYSTGEDGKDDGGDPNPPQVKSPGLWEGRDAVWPVPADE